MSLLFRLRFVRGKLWQINMVLGLAQLGGRWAAVKNDQLLLLRMLHIRKVDVVVPWRLWRTRTSVIECLTLNQFFNTQSLLGCRR